MTRAVQIAELGDQNVFSVDSDNDRVGIGSTQPTVKLDVTGDGNVSGTLTATSFSGDVTGTATGLSGSPNITINNLTGVAATFTGVLTYEDVTNVDSVGIVTARSGIQIPNDSGKLRSGTDLEMQVFHDGTNSVVKDTRNSGKVRIQADNFDVIDKDASITMLSATSTGVSLLGDIDVADKIVHTGDTNTAIRFPAADTFTVETAGSERIRVLPGGGIGINTTPGTLLEIQGASGSEATVTFNREGVQGTNDGVIGQLLFENHTDSVAQISVLRESAADDAYIQVATQATGGSFSEKLRITSVGEVRVGSAFSVGQAGVCTASSFTDSIGDVRSIPLKTESSSASYTLIASDAGKTIHVHSTTTTVVVPNSVFSAGDAVSIVNGDGSNTPTISQGTGFSLRNTGDGSTGNRTLGVFGMATIYFTGAGVGYISGSGMT